MNAPVPGQPENTDSGSPGNREPDKKEADPAKTLPFETESGLTLERIIELTGEFEHLNCLITRHIEKTGGFSGTDAYFKTVQPVLDMLEVEIRVRYRSGMSRDQVKLIVQDWIDQEIRDLR